MSLTNVVYSITEEKGAEKGVSEDYITTILGFKNLEAIDCS